jgi:Methyltransferase FkbM domain
LSVHDDGSPLASLFEHKLNGNSVDSLRIELGKSISVPMDTVDDFMLRQELSYIDVLKVDTEGYEFHVFSGGARAFENHSIGCAAFEFGMHQVESRHFFKDFFEFFESYGYEMFQFVDGTSMPIPRYEYKYENFTGNFIFCAASRNEL